MKKDAIRAMSRARQRAEQTPDEVRAAFLQKRTEVCGVTLHPFTLGIIWLLEEIGHPIMDPAGVAEAGTLKTRQMAEAIFIFSAPGEAREALAAGREVFDESVHQRAMQIPPGEIKTLANAIAQIVKEGLATVPGALEEQSQSQKGNPRPPAGAENA